MDIKNLIEMFSKLPNLGPASSRRLILHLIRNKEKIMLPLAHSIRELAERVVECEICGNLETKSPCSICLDQRRNTKLLCVVEDLGDLWAFEKGKIYSGLYHILGGTLSAINGIGPKELNLQKIISRVKESGVEEVIIATNSTLDGQVTAHYIVDLLKDLNIKVSRLACGIPIGGEIDYLDEGTLNAALCSRQEINSAKV
ncbi:recombination mediator RecR [Candidatus Mesenet endosymbiont of Agriotes lineatus]|uniref:recombination mediator RecR n=1 Tax=Candidatus Mesenet endosymbiont of Agriotes lineatus TaxID=3077948 RepID=UPI0030D25D80